MESSQKDAVEQPKEMEEIKPVEPEGTESAKKAETERKTLEVKANEEFSITLESNPTTGYSWEVEFDNNYLELTNKEFIESASGGLIGSGGKEIFDFLVLEPGEVEITFSYLRPWEEEAIKKTIYQIIIR